MNDILIFDSKIKLKFLNSSKELSSLYEAEMRKDRSEVEFWKEFFSHQINNQTILSGGFKPLYFTKEQNLIFFENLNKKRQSNLPIGSFLNITYNTSASLNLANFVPHTPSNMSTINSIFNRKNEVLSISISKSKQLSLHSLFKHPSYGNFKPMNEYDNCDLSLKREFNIEDRSGLVRDLVRDINSYSMSKLEGHKNSSQFINKIVQKVFEGTHTFSNQDNQMEMDTVSSCCETAHNQQATELSKLPTNFTLYPEQSLKAFHAINEITLTIRLTSEVSSMNEEENKAMKEIKFYSNLVRDLICILMNLKTTRNISEDERKNKNNSIAKVYKTIRDKAKRFRESRQRYRNLSALIDTFYDFTSLVNRQQPSQATPATSSSSIENSY